MGQIFPKGTGMRKAPDLDHDLVANPNSILANLVYHGLSHIKLQYFTIFCKYFHMFLNLNENNFIFLIISKLK